MMTSEVDRLWALSETLSGFLKWYVRRDLRGMKATREGLVRILDGFILSVELRAHDEEILDGDLPEP